MTTLSYVFTRNNSGHAPRGHEVPHHIPNVVCNDRRKRRIRGQEATSMRGALLSAATVFAVQFTVLFCTRHPSVEASSLSAMSVCSSVDAGYSYRQNLVIPPVGHKRGQPQLQRRNAPTNLSSAVLQQLRGGSNRSSSSPSHRPAAIASAVVKSPSPPKTVTEILPFPHVSSAHLSASPTPVPPSVRRDLASTNNKKLLLLIRILFLTYYGSLGSLLPYLPVYYFSLGHGGLAIGMLGAVKPLTTFLIAPVWGILSDSAQNHSFILQFTFISSLILQLLLCVREDVYYLVGIGFVTALLNAPVKSLIDSMVLDKLKDRGQYGRLRLWGQLGFGLGSSAVGVLLSRTGSNKIIMTESISAGSLNLYDLIQMGVNRIKNINGYKIAFLAHGALSIPAFLCMRAFERFDNQEELMSKHHITNAAIHTKKRQDKKTKTKEGARIVKGIGLLLHNSDALLFFFLVFIVGTSSGIVENFAYVRIREVGGTGREMGLSRLVSSAAGAPMFWFSGPLTELLGADRVLVLSLLSYVVRFAIYAAMKNPYQGLPAEALRGVTFAAFWSTGTVFAHRISPPGMGATMLMFLNAMYGGLGQSLGAIIGGKLQSKFGTVKTFIYSGIFDLVFVSLLIMYLCVRKNSNFRNPTPILPPGTITR